MAAEKPFNVLLPEGCCSISFCVVLLFFLQFHSVGECEVLSDLFRAAKVHLLFEKREKIAKEMVAFVTFSKINCTFADK